MAIPRLQSTTTRTSDGKGRPVLCWWRSRFAPHARAVSAAGQVICNRGLLASMEVGREAFAATGRRVIQQVVEPLAEAASFPARRI